MKGLPRQSHHYRHQYPTRGVFPMGVSLKKLLIKSQPFFVHRHTQQFTVDTILRLKAKIVPTVQK